MEVTYLLQKKLWAGRFSELVFGTSPLCCKGSPSKSKDVQSFLLSDATYHIRLVEVLLLVPSNSCQGQGANALHSADAVTAGARVVLNRQKKSSRSSGFFVWSCCFCLVFWFVFFLERRWWEAGRRWRMAAHPGKGAGAVLGAEPAPAPGPPPPPREGALCHRREGPRPEGKQKWAHTANYRIFAMRRGLLRPAVAASWLLSVCLHPQGAAQSSDKERFSWNTTHHPIPMNTCVPTRWAA